MNIEHRQRGAKVSPSFFVDIFSKMIILISKRKEPIMMTFNQFNEATNSIKPAIIHKRNDPKHAEKSPDKPISGDI
jgi:hypothetical protein